MQGTCERCNKRGEVKTVQTKDKQQTARLCQECITNVIRPNTAWEVKQ